MQETGQWNHLNGASHHPEEDTVAEGVMVAEVGDMVAAGAEVLIIEDLEGDLVVAVDMIMEMVEKIGKYERPIYC